MLKQWQNKHQIILYARSNGLWIRNIRDSKFNLSLRISRWCRCHASIQTPQGARKTCWVSKYPVKTSVWSGKIGVTWQQYCGRGDCRCRLILMKAQRQTTKDAAKLAGIHVIRLLNEPTAAAMAAFETKHKTKLIISFMIWAGHVWRIGVKAQSRCVWSAGNRR